MLGCLLSVNTKKFNIKALDKGFFLSIIIAIESIHSVSVQPPDTSTLQYVLHSCKSCTILEVAACTKITLFISVSVWQVFFYLGFCVVFHTAALFGTLLLTILTVGGCILTALVLLALFFKEDIVTCTHWNVCMLMI